MWSTKAGESRRVDEQKTKSADNDRAYRLRGDWRISLFEVRNVSVRARKVATGTTEGKQDMESDDCGRAPAGRRV